MLVALIYLYTVSGGSFSILEWYQLPLSLEDAGTAVRRLLRRVRGQGADVAGAHLAARRARRAPTGGSVVLAADHAEGRSATASSASSCRSCPTRAITSPGL